MSINASYSETGTTSGATVRRDTLRELFAYNDWGRDQLLALAAGLKDEQLNRAFEMGMGTLRNTLHHLWGAERIWLDRWHLVPKPVFVQPESGLSIADLWMRFRATGNERNEWLLLKQDPELHKAITFTNMKGETHSFQLGDMMLHVCNHGAHHRAQALNMLRHIGVKPPWLDYLALWKSHPPGTPAPNLQLRTVREFFAYGDWATRRVLDAAQKLTDAQLDQSFDMGLGTLRKTLLHIRFAEQWWNQNWAGGASQPFPELPDGTSLVELQQLADQTAQQRNAYLDTLADADLLKPVAAMPRPGMTLSFPLGTTMLQLCHHGTHHRAQALNMLRRLGGETPGLDCILWIRDGKPLHGRGPI